MEDQITLKRIRNAYGKLLKAAKGRRCQLNVNYSSWNDGEVRYAAYIDIEPIGAHGGIGLQVCKSPEEAVDECIKDFEAVEKHNEDIKNGRVAKEEDMPPFWLIRDLND